MGSNGRLIFYGVVAERSMRKRITKITIKKLAHYWTSF